MDARPVRPLNVQSIRWVDLMAQVIETTKLLTAEEFAVLPEDGCHQYELVRGEVVLTMPPMPQHGRLQLRFGAQLSSFVDERGLGEVLTECGFTLARGPDTVRAPDIAFVSAARIAAGGLPDNAFPEGAPDLAIEIRSSSNTGPELEAKADEYLAAGARLVWIVDPARRRARVRRADGTVADLGEDDSLDGEDVLPGYRSSLRPLFR
jgi:Uma2 family endonuclease